MRPDIVNLRQFYASRLGRRVKARLCQMVLTHWPEHKGAPIVGIGYATPVLHALEKAGPTPALVIPLMPAVQGAIYWPVHMENQSVLGDEMRLPFAAGSLTRIVVLHAFEYAARPDEFLSVLWATLAPGGRVLLAVPNRRGLWARLGATPFAQGTPYRLATLKTLLDAANFTRVDVTGGLYAPPSTHGVWLQSWGIMEWVGRIFFPHRGGIIMIEAEKQIYAAVGERLRTPNAARQWQVEPNVVAIKTAPNI